MSEWQRLVGDFGTLQLAALFVVLLVRRHYRVAPLFTLYTGGVCATSIFFRLHYTREAWMVHQVNVAGLRFLVALELAHQIFGAFPAAAATARRVMLALLVATAAIAMSIESRDFEQFSATLVPTFATGTVWILTVLAGLVLWYRLPLTVLQKAILVGLAAYLLVFTVVMNLLASLGWQHRDSLSYVNTVSYQFLKLYWIWIAWTTAPQAVVSVQEAAVGEMARQPS